VLELERELLTRWAGVGDRILLIVDNDDLKPIAADVRTRLARVVEHAAQP
jgi:hypothetical protein